MKWNSYIALNGTFSGGKPINGIETPPTSLYIHIYDESKIREWCFSYEGFGEFCIESDFFAPDKALLMFSDSRDATAFSLIT